MVPRSAFRTVGAFALSPLGGVYVHDPHGHRIRQLRPRNSGPEIAAFSVPTEDGSEIYEFSAFGQHIRTRHGLTGDTVLVFGYDAAGRLITTVQDIHGLVTTIERDSLGTPIGMVKVR